MSDVLSSFRGEWLKLSKRPATWVLGLILAALLLTVTYGVTVLVVMVLSGEPSSRPGVRSGLHTLKPMLYPAHFLQMTLAPFSGLGYGNAIAVILGALAYGSEYGWATLKTVFTQRPGRLATLAGKLMAVALTLAVYALLILVVGAAASAVLGAVYGSLTPWPAMVDVAKAFLAAWLIMGLWAALGIVLAVLFRQTALAIGLGIVYAIGIEGLVVNTLSLVSSLQNVRRGFPGANASALVASFGGATTHPLVVPAQAISVVAAYAAVCLLITALAVRRRDVT